jgi:hypothetical protein|tara:strand:- start:22389 stop:22700 length:312 start_codon:yes stop_codon:yes gene_type:complete
MWHILEFIINKFIVLSIDFCGRDKYWKFNNGTKKLGEWNEPYNVSTLCEEQKEPVSRIRVSDKAQEQLDAAAARIPQKIREMNPHMSWGIKDSKYNPKGMYKG